MNIFDTIGKLMSQVSFQFCKHAPKILVGAGVTGIVVSSVIACKATLKVPDVVNKRDEEISDIAKKYNDAESNVYKKEVVAAHLKAGINLAKLYLPSIGLGAVSIFCILTSNNMMCKRNAGLAAAYMTVDTALKKYRSNVVDRYGEDVDKELRYGTKEIEIEEAFIDENGEPKKIDGKIKVVDIDESSDYARYFDSSAEAWLDSGSEYNTLFLRGQQNAANTLFRIKKYFFLNDVYEMLGIKKSVAGQSVGWIYDENNSQGDNYIDFGIKDVCRRNKETGELEHVILLDFNVDGVIWERAQKMNLLSK